MMKKVLTILMLTVVASSVTYAGPTVGSWTAPVPGFSDGLWLEVLINGNQGQVGNTISASGGNWSLIGATLSVAPIPILNPPYAWRTTYVGGTLTLAAAGPWDGGGTPYSVGMGPITVDSSGALPNGMIAWTMSGAGTVTGWGNPVTLSANYNGGYILIPNPPLPPNMAIMMGTGLTNQTTVTIVPAPGALLLGGLGVSLLAVIRRRRMF